MVLHWIPQVLLFSRAYGKRSELLNVTVLSWTENEHTDDHEFCFFNDCDCFFSGREACTNGWGFGLIICLTYIPKLFPGTNLQTLVNLLPNPDRDLVDQLVRPSLGTSPRLLAPAQIMRFSSASLSVWELDPRHLTAETGINAFDTNFTLSFWMRRHIGQSHSSMANSEDMEETIICSQDQNGMCKLVYVVIRNVVCTFKNVYNSTWPREFTGGVVRLWTTVYLKIYEGHPLRKSAPWNWTAVACLFAKRLPLPLRQERKKYFPTKLQWIIFWT